MKKTFGQMVVEFRLHWKNYVFQRALATVVLPFFRGQNG